MTTPHKPRHAAPSPPDAGHEDGAFAGPDGPASWATTSSQAEAAASMSGQPGPADVAPAEAAPAATWPETAQSEAAWPEPAQPEAAQPEAARPEAARLEVAQPEAVRPEPARPEAAQPEAARLEVAQPEAARPEPARPEPAQPEVAQSEAARLEGPQSVAGRAGAPWPDAPPPGGAALDGTALSGTALPGAAGREPERSRIARPARRGTGPLRLIWVYPDLLSTYGDRGNLLVLERRARLRGIEVEPVEVNSDQPVPRQGDIYLMGGGEDLPQILAARRLRADGGLSAAADQGAVVFAVCAGYQVIGNEFGGVDGEPVQGLGILNIRSGRGERRGVGEIVADVDPELGLPRLTGFENHQGVTSLRRGVKPLARVTRGVGNGDGTEGAYAGSVLGTYLHGPALVRNPGLADLLLGWAVGPLEPLDSADENWARLLREERLAAVS